MIPYSTHKIYGPYIRKSDNRKYVVVQNFQGRKAYTVMYARYLKEISIGRYLASDEQVHHIDGNLSNDVLENLQVMKQDDHAKLHNSKYPTQSVLTCVYCLNRFRATNVQMRHLKQNRRRGHFGPMCSKRCVGLYGTELQSRNRLSNALKFGETLTNGNAEPSS